MTCITIFSFDEAVGSSTSRKVLNCSDMLSFSSDMIIKRMQEGNATDSSAYTDKSFSFPIPNNVRPFEVFPMLNIDIKKIDMKDMPSAVDENPHIVLTSSQSDRFKNIQVIFHHIHRQIPAISYYFPVKVNPNSTIASFIDELKDGQSWGLFSEYIARILGINKSRIVLHFSPNLENHNDKILFSFEKVEAIMSTVVDKSNGIYSFKGLFMFEILPNIYELTDSHVQQLPEEFNDDEESRINCLQSLPSSIMRSITNFQKRIFQTIHKSDLPNIVPILAKLISTEFKFNADDNYIKIALKHILSASLVDIFILFISWATKTLGLYNFKTWQELSGFCVLKDTKNKFLLTEPASENIVSWSVGFFLVTSPTFVKDFVDLSYRFYKYFAVSPEEIRRPPAQINTFLGPVIFATGVEVDGTNYVLLLTRGFLYLVNGSIVNGKEMVAFEEMLSLEMNSSETFSIPLSMCHFLPVPDANRQFGFIASKWSNVRVKFQNPNLMLGFLILFSLSKNELDKKVIYPIQVPESSAQFSFMSNQIHAKVQVSNISSWDVYFTFEKVMNAFSSAGNFKIAPNGKPSTFRLTSTEYSVNCFGSNVMASNLSKLVLDSALESSIKNFNNSWSFSMLNDMIFNFSSKASFEGLLLLKISDFAHAITTNNKELLKLQLENFHSFTSTFNVNDTPLLHYASLICSDSGIVRILLQKWKRSNQDNAKHLRTALFYALRNPNISILQALLDSEIDVDQANSDKISPLVYCLHNHDIERAQLLLRNGASVHRTLNSNYSSALEYAISTKHNQNHRNNKQNNVNNNVNPNTNNNVNNSNNDLNQYNMVILNLLMPYCGQQINAPNASGQFVTHLCLNANFLDALKVIESIDEYFNPNLFSDQFPHPLHYIFSKEGGNNFTVAHLQALLRIKRINVNCRDKNGDTPLIRALKENVAPFFQIIAKDSRCDIDAYDGKGMSALYIAVQKNDVKAVQILVEAGALTNQPNADGDTPMFCAVRNANTEITKRLLSCRTDPNMWYFQGNLPNHIAPQNILADLPKLTFRKFENV